MDYSDKTRRTMSDALRTGALGDDAREFLTGRPPKAPAPENPDAPPETAIPASPGESTPDPSGGVPWQNGVCPASLPEASVVVPGIVSMTFRLPARLSGRLAGVSAERKLRRERPFSQQDIVAEALRLWLHRNGYLDLDRN